MSPVRTAHPDVHRLLCVLLLALAVGFAGSCRRSGETASPDSESELAHLMNVGKNYYDKGEALRAVEPFEKAVRLNPQSAEAHLNLANALLLANRAEEALPHSLLASELDRNLAAAHYVSGCAQLRLRRYEEALKSLQTAKDLEPSVGAVTFQLAKAHQELGQWDAAIEAFEELVGFEPEHPAAWYMLGQALIRAGRQEEARTALDKHAEIIARQPGTMDVAKLERCVHTAARAPFILERPKVTGVPVTFTDVTEQVVPGASGYRGPIAVIDYHHDGRNSLFVAEGAGFVLLANSNGTFHPLVQFPPAASDIRPRECLVADLQNDRFDDILVLGEQGTRLFRLATNAQVHEATQFSRLGSLGAKEGALLDLDFTGKLDLLAITSTNQAPRVLRNLGNLYFRDITATSGVPAEIEGLTQIAVEDWNNDELLDLVLARSNQPPVLLLKERGGPLVRTNSPADWPAGERIVAADFNNDLRADLIIFTPESAVCFLNGAPDPIRIPVRSAEARKVLPLDYDNDGWLDLLLVGERVRLFRNLDRAGFQETTPATGLDRLAGAADSLAAADFDQDGDTDLAFSMAQGGIRILRNDGGNANFQVKVRLLGNRSNASGFGTRVEVTAGGMRLGRRVFSLPVEIGVGQHQRLESLNARWLNLSLNNVDVEVDPKTTLPLLELALPEGSCPYLYVWDGSQYRFVTDLLGSAPLGLRVSENRFVESDPDEYVAIGGEEVFRPRDGHYELQITEELREVLYLDQAELVAVDLPADAEVFPTGKMVPSRPFPSHGFMALHQEIPLRRADRSDGLEVTESLRRVDQQSASPVALRIPQLRGLAEPWSVTLDYGPLPTDEPLVLAITGWLRFGGGMANVAASHHPELPFPFPTLEAETEEGRWHPADVVFGTPAGKTKRMVVDLTGKLPAGTRRLRIQTAYELHWDRIALLRKADATALRLTRLAADYADLHYRGFSRFQDLPWHRPLTPDYQDVSLNPAWRITPAGWCTRYGDVRELIQHRDNSLALLNGGDEVTLRFAASRLGPVPAGHRREFFLYSVGWDKDSDFHCEKGWKVEPLPWHGMDDQAYGQQERPAMDNDAWIARYNTRWVGPWVPRRTENARMASR